MLGIYYFLKLTLFFAIVKALVRSEALGGHALALGVMYTTLVGFISYAFILTTQPGAFHADWVMQVHRATGLSPWLSWLAATLVLSTAYFKLLGRFDEGAIFWVVLALGIPVSFF